MPGAPKAVGVPALMANAPAAVARSPRSNDPSSVRILYLRGTNITGNQGGDSGDSVDTDNIADGSESGTSNGYVYFSTIDDETTNRSMSLVTCCY